MSAIDQDELYEAMCLLAELAASDPASAPLADLPWLGGARPPARLVEAAA